jgi:hypothetical protein
MEQKWYANIVMSIFPLLLDAEAISTSIYVARNIRMASVKNISLFMVRRDGDSESDKIAASEALVTYHTVRHGESFRTQMNAC